MKRICTDLSKEARVENFYASGITFGAGGWGATFTKSDVFSPTPLICTFRDTQCRQALSRVLPIFVNTIFYIFRKIFRRSFKRSNNRKLLCIGYYFRCWGEAGWGCEHPVTPPYSKICKTTCTDIGSTHFRKNTFFMLKEFAPIFQKKQKSKTFMHLILLSMLGGVVPLFTALWTGTPYSGSSMTSHTLYEVLLVFVKIFLYISKILTRIFQKKQKSKTFTHLIALWICGLLPTQEAPFRPEGRGYD